MTDRRSGYRSVMLAAAFFFAGPGLGYGLFVSRLPALRERCGADDADLGLVLLVMGLTSLAALLLSGPIIARLGSRRLLPPLMVLMSAALLGVGGAGSVGGLGVAAACVGFTIALLDVAINTQGITIEKSYASKSMSTLHACYNIGGIGGAALASVAAYLGWSPLLNFTLAMLLYCAAVCPASHYLIADDAPPAERSSAADHAPRRGCLSMPFIIYLCGLLSMGGYMVEGSVGEWGSVLLHAYKGAHEAVAALVYGTFSAACVVSRLSADWLRSRVREEVLVGCCAGGAGLCLSAVLGLSQPLACLICYALLGLCLGPVIPILFSLAGAAPGVSAAQASSFVGLMAYSGLLLFPPAIGYAAAAAGLDKALFIPVAVCALMAVATLFLRPAARP